MINDSKEQGTQGLLFPSGKEHVKHHFPSRHPQLLLEVAELPVECVPVTFLFTSDCASAAAQICKDSQVKTELATHTDGAVGVVCVHQHRVLNTSVLRRQRDPQIAWNQGWEVGTEGGRAGWLLWRAAPCTG